VIERERERQAERGARDIEIEIIEIQRAKHPPTLHR